jgi:hypothetical protein
MTAFGFAFSIAVTLPVRFTTDLLAGAAFAGVFPATGLLAFALLTGFFATLFFVVTTLVFFATGFVTFLITAFLGATFVDFFVTFAGVAFFLVVFFFVVAILTSLK